MSYLVIGIIMITVAFHVFVETLNYRHRNTRLPENVKDLYDEHKYASWMQYTMENFRLGISKSGIFAVIWIILFLSGFFGVLEQSINNLTPSLTFQIVIFVWCCYVITIGINTPFAYYRTFVIEEKYGFNKTSKGLFFFDILKSLVLISLLGGAMVLGLASLFITFGDRLVVLLAISYGAIIVGTLLVFLLNGIFIRAFNKLKPIEDGSLKLKINELAKRLGFSIKRIYVMDASKRSTKLNAFFTGLGKTREVVLYDTLIAKLTEEEILAVLAHELGHATHKDSWKLLIRQDLLFAVYVLLFGVILGVEAFFTGFGLSGIHYGFAMVLLLFLIEPVDIILGILMNHLSRVAEYQADAYAKKHTDSVSMQGALRKLTVANYSNLTPHPLYQLLYYSHPTISHRLSALEKEQPSV